MYFIYFDVVQEKRYLIWSGGIHECEGFKNKRINIDKLIIDKKDKVLVTLVGDLDVTSDTTKDLAVRQMICITLSTDTSRASIHLQFLYFATLFCFKLCITNVL